MSTAFRKSSAKTGTLLRANPILNRLGKVQERAETNTATYAGIASKTTYFLAVTLVGMVLQMIVNAALASEPVWQQFTVYESFTVSLNLKETLILGAVAAVGFICELVGVFVPRTIPVTGTVYSAGQGYLISFLVFKVLAGNEYIGLEALLLTVVVVAAMCWLYSSGIVKVDQKFRSVLLALVLGSVGFSLISFIGSLIPATREYVQMMLQNSWLTMIIDVIGLVIAALFLISDFNMVDTCVREGYPKKYEWVAAFGLVFTVLWIYLKILDLLMELNGKKDK